MLTKILLFVQNDGSGRKVVLHGGGQFWNFSEKPACIVYGEGGSGSGGNHAVKTLRHGFLCYILSRKVVVRRQFYAEEV